MIKIDKANEQLTIVLTDRSSKSDTHAMMRAICDSICEYSLKIGESRRNEHDSEKLDSMDEMATHIYFLARLLGNMAEEPSPGL